MLRLEVIGNEACPILHRWTLIPWGNHERADRAARWKLMVHHFLPNADDRDVHDHPRGFWTLVLWGGYDDMKQCERCEGWGILESKWGGQNLVRSCLTCKGEGVVLRERMRPGMLRYRPAQHAHRTKVHASGCWTIVLMGPLERAWGFWRGRLWIPWMRYHAEFGDAMRCE